MKFVKLSQKLRKYALNVRSVTLRYAHIQKVTLHNNYTLQSLILKMQKYRRKKNF